MHTLFYLSGILFIRVKGFTLYKNISVTIHTALSTSSLFTACTSYESDP